MSGLLPRNIWFPGWKNIDQKTLLAVTNVAVQQTYFYTPQLKKGQDYWINNYLDRRTRWIRWFARSHLASDRILASSLTVTCPSFRPGRDSVYRTNGRGDAGAELPVAAAEGGSHFVRIHNPVG